jgi:integrase
MAGNGRVKAKTVLVAGKEIVFPKGVYQLRTYDNDRVIYRSLEHDHPGDALAARDREEKLRRLKHDAENNGIEVTVPDGEKTLHMLRDDFMRKISLTNGASGQSGYKIAIDSFLSSVRKRFPAEIEPEDLMLFVKAQRAHPYADRTVWNQYHRVVYFLLSHCGVTKKQLPDRQDRPKKEDKTVESYQQDEIDGLLASCKSSRVLLWEFLLKTGLREQECVFLEWENIKFDQRVVNLYSKPKLGFRMKANKGRKVPLEAGLLDQLRAHHDANKKKQFVFTSATGEQDWNMLHSLKRDARNANVACGVCAGCRRPKRKSQECKRWYLHKFRATFATTCLQRGMDLHTLMELMGHTSLKSTIRYLASAQKDTVQSQINAIWGKPSNVVVMPVREQQLAG